MYDRDTLLAAVDLRQLADQLLGQTAQRGQTRTWPCPNPDHHQTGRTPPVTIFNSRRGDQRWRCHGCGEGGTAIDLVMAARHATVAEAMAELAQRCGVGDTSVPRPSAAVVPSRVPAAVRLDQLETYVGECATRLWTASGARHLRWLTAARGLSADVLRRNLVGSDPGWRSQERPDGLPRGGGVVLPAVERGRPRYAQVRAVGANQRGPRYRNPRSDRWPNPRLVRVRPANLAQPEVLVTEGIIDGLSAASAGYRAVAVLSATLGDEMVAAHLAHLRWPLVLAFDPDEAGVAGAQRLAAYLEARGRPAASLDLPAGRDVNDALRASSNWSVELTDHVRAARRAVGIDIPAR